jgi:hypothetical protein
MAAERTDFSSWQILSPFVSVERYIVMLHS